MKKYLLFNKVETAVRLAAAGFLFLMAVSGATAHGQDDTLPPRAEEATKLGVSAAAKEEWKLAIKYFKEARKAAPYSRIALFNLAMAYDKAGRYELVAITWYRAYLAAASSAQDAQTQNRGRLVRERIAALEGKVEADIQELVQKAKEMATKHNKNSVYRDIAVIQAMAGDVTGARKTAAEIQIDETKDSFYAEIAEILARAGDIAGAKTTADTIEDMYYRALAYAGIACAQVKAGERMGASKTIALAKEAAGKDYEDNKAYYFDLYDKTDDRDYNRTRAYIKIANVQAKAGDMTGARQTIALAKTAAEKIHYKYFRTYAYIDTAEAQSQVGDKSGALLTTRLAKEAAVSIKEHLGSERDEVYAHIAQSEAEAGDLASAKKTAGGIKETYWKTLAYAGIAETQVKLGDKSGARKTNALAREAAAEIKDSRNTLKDEAYARIAQSEAEAGDFAGAMAVANEIKDIAEKLKAFRAAAKSEAEADEITGTRKSNTVMTRAEAGLKIGKRIVDEIDCWAGLFSSGPVRPVFPEWQPEWQTFIASLMGKQPSQAVDAVIRVVQNMAGALQDIRYNNAKWQKLRMPANR